ncbi:MAG: hypothetical protein WC683_07725 [bacterium]|jgi:hypothetical protein
MRYWIGEDDQLVVIKNDTNGFPPPWREVIPVVVGSREFAAVMILRGEQVWNDGLGESNAGHRRGETEASMYCLLHDSAALGLDTGWYLLPPSPPPLKRWDRVRWWRGKDSGTGTYWDSERGWEYPHLVFIGEASEDHYLSVERVERLDPDVERIEEAER